MNGQWVGNLKELLEANPDFRLHLMSFFYERTKSVGAGSTGKQLDEGEDVSSFEKLKKHSSLVCDLNMSQLVRYVPRSSH